MQRIYRLRNSREARRQSGQHPDSSPHSAVAGLTLGSTRLDFLMLALLAAGFVGAVAYVYACRRLIDSDHAGVREP